MSTVNGQPYKSKSHQHHLPTFYIESQLPSGSESDSSCQPESCESSETDTSEEWEQEVSEKGELFYIRAHPSIEDTRNSGRDNPDASPTLDVPSVADRSSQKHKHIREHIKRFRRRKEFSVSPLVKQDSSSIAQQPMHFVSSISKEVILTVNDKQPNFCRRSSPLEALLGIIPVNNFSKDNELSEKNSTSDLIIIQALVPGSNASKNQDIHIGDWIYKINDSEVTCNNIDQILAIVMSSQSKQIKLSLRKLAETHKQQQSDSLPQIITTCSGLLIPKLLNTDEEHWANLSSLPHVALYLTLGNSEMDDPKDEIIFQFPSTANKLVDIRGALVTLSHMLPDIAGSGPTSSSLLVDSRVVHVGYAREEKEVMLFAVPSTSMTACEVSYLTSSIARTLKYQYDSLHKAFSDKLNKLSVNHLFALTFANCLLTTLCHGHNFMTPTENNLSKHFKSPQYLPLSSELKCTIDGILNEFESADFADMSESQYGMRRLYSIIGTCFFYKGYLVASHLPTSELEDVFLYLHHMGILETSTGNSIMNAVIWKEVFPKKAQETVQSNARWFLLVIGRNHSLFGTLLEAGGCASRVTGTPGPEPFYVDQAKAILLQLDVLQITKSLDLWIDTHSFPSLVSTLANDFEGKRDAKEMPSSMKNGDKMIMQTLKKASSSSKLSLNTFPSRQQSQRDLMAQSKKDPQGETDSDSTSLSLTASGTSDDTIPILGRQGKEKNPSRRQSWSDTDSHDENDYPQQKRYLPSLLDLAVMSDKASSVIQDRNTLPLKLTTGPHNVLFHYLQFNLMDGVLICPVKADEAANGEYQAEIVRNFKSSCLIIQKLLHTSSQSKTSTTSYIEQGMLFKSKTSSTNDLSKEMENVSYWVVGRLFFTPYPREVYICYHDSCPQAIVEMAFQLSFGLSF